MSRFRLREPSGGWPATDRLYPWWCTFVQYESTALEPTPSTSTADRGRRDRRRGGRGRGDPGGRPVGSQRRDARAVGRPSAEGSSRAVPGSSLLRLTRTSHTSSRRCGRSSAGRRSNGRAGSACCGGRARSPTGSSPIASCPPSGLAGSRSSSSAPRGESFRRQAGRGAATAPPARCRRYSRRPGQDRPARLARAAGAELQIGERRAVADRGDDATWSRRTVGGGARLGDRRGRPVDRCAAGRRRDRAAGGRLAPIGRLLRACGAIRETGGADRVRGG